MLIHNYWYCKENYSENVYLLLCGPWSLLMWILLFLKLKNIIILRYLNVQTLWYWARTKVSNLLNTLMLQFFCKFEISDCSTQHMYIFFDPTVCFAIVFLAVNFLLFCQTFNTGFFEHLSSSNLVFLNIKIQNTLFAGLHGGYLSLKRTVSLLVC